MNITIQNKLTYKVPRAGLGHVALAAIFVLLLAACQTSLANELSEAEAIDLARSHVTFEPTSIEAVKATEDERKVWRITFRRTQGAIPMGNTMMVSIDRVSGEVVSLARG